MRLGVYGLALLVGMASPCAAAFLTGNDLHEACTSQSRNMSARYYVLGVFDQTLATGFGTGKNHCVPVGVSDVQITDVVCGYLARRPQDRQNPAALLSYRAIIEAWPCQKQ